MMEEKKGCVFNIQRFSIHDGPGIRTTIFFKGCPLRCTWCSNPESQRRAPEPIWDNIKKKEIITGEYYTIEELMTTIRKDLDYYHESGGGVTVTGGEVLAQKDFVLALLQACRQEGIHTTCETSAYSSQKDFQELLENTDLLIMDIKHYDDIQHLSKTHVHLAPILKNLDQAVHAQRKVLIRIPIIPGFNDSLADAERFGLLLKSHNVQQVELLPFHQFGKSKYKYLNRIYEFDNVPQLTSEDLIPYSEVIKRYQVDCLIA